MTNSSTEDRTSKGKKKRRPLAAMSVVARSALTELVRVNAIDLLAAAFREECEGSGRWREHRLAAGTRR